METRPIIIALLSLIPLFASGQGALTPPGAPAPTMKSLSQVEPRTPISSLPFTITNSGSYYLTTNLIGSAGISVNTSDVTLDLNGFALAGPDDGNGILVSSPQTGICIRNGNARHWSAGINATNAGYSRFEQLKVANNVVIGLATGDSCLVRDCIALTNTFADGISVGSYSTITGCIANGNTLSGIRLASGCVAEGNSCNFNNSAGIITAGNGNRIDGNIVNGNAGAGGVYAAAVSSTNNLIIRNNARGNLPQNYNTQPNNALGAVVSGAGGITITTNSPWANFSF